MAQQNQYFPQSRPHPGETLEEKLEEMGMGPKEFAIRVGKPEKTIIAVLKGESSITPDMAIQFENVTKIPAHFWMDHQKSYDEYKARVKHEEAIEAAVEWAKSFPVAAMARCGWITKRTTWKDKAAELLEFFGFANHGAWEQYYFKQQLKIAFRISLASTSQPYAISAWLRMGQLQAGQLEVAEYNEKVFKAQLEKIKTLMAKHPDDFFDQLQSLCAEAGVKVVQTPCLPKAPLNGSTRWINDNPLIQLTGRHKRNDIFWFTFFHEAGHIVLHRKKDIFLEDVEYSDKDMEKEQEADDFAAKWLLTEEEEQTIIDAAPLDEEMIHEFAEKFNTHPAIIVGRLQHKGLVRHSQGRQFFEKVEFD
ncbi:HigA family addiction module antitoxin [Salibacter halophilus]|uniref:HigA family addiction module antidote protein n=1 Tax=Salibacter halophilus TaxID=1803916 RepID=A0A6N6M8S6_9FLAO|nr:HigA family addiction module antitoxin [Salibacter halophilus]KAB1065132.1 HigA family addiction module antidote protein [Salibacter halophilus]